MSNLHLTLATTDYDHIRDLATGAVKPKGIDLTWLMLDVEEIFHRFIFGQEWDVSEISMGMSTSRFSYGDAPFVLIPVFPSRVFRHSAFYICADGPIKKPEDLKGSRIGVPEWGQTAGIYARGWMQHEVGIPLEQIAWIQSGVNDPGRQEAAKLDLPEGLNVTPVNDRSVTQMMLDGDLDAIISARPPNEFLKGNPRVVRLFPDYRQAEEDYYRKTGIFPIMHHVGIRRSTYEKDPWVAMEMFKAFTEAKDRSFERLRNFTASQIAVPWGYHNVMELTKLFYPDGDYWAYGIEKNRTTLEAFLLYCAEQGTMTKHMKPEEIYVEECQHFFKY
jgi:4,5-dihydroxyphthalate decarboxylase